MAREVVRFKDVAGKDILWPNFEGRAGDYNNPGERNFCLRLTEEEYHQLLDAGYTSPKEKVRMTEDGEEYVNRYIPIKVNFNSQRPPQIHQVTRRGLVKLDEDSCALIDRNNIKKASIAFTPYYRKVSNTQTAYLQEMLVEFEEESFADEYLNDHFSSGDEA